MWDLEQGTSHICRLMWDLEQGDLPHSLHEVYHTFVPWFGSLSKVIYPTVMKFTLGKALYWTLESYVIHSLRFPLWGTLSKALCPTFPKMWQLDYATFPWCCPWARHFTGCCLLDTVSMMWDSRQVTWFSMNMYIQGTGPHGSWWLTDWFLILIQSPVSIEKCLFMMTCQCILVLGLNTEKNGGVEGILVHRVCWFLYSLFSSNYSLLSFCLRL